MRKAAIVCFVCLALWGCSKKVVVKPADLLGDSSIDLSSLTISTSSVVSSIPVINLTSSVTPENVCSTSTVKSPDIRSMQNVYFDVGQYDIGPGYVNNLTIETTNDLVDCTVILEGYCDPRGSAEYNCILGMKRAESVKKCMIDLGFDKDRFILKSHGKSAAKGTHEGTWQLDRRVEITIRLD